MIKWATLSRTTSARAGHEANLVCHEAVNSWMLGRLAKHPFAELRVQRGTGDRRHAMSEFCRTAFEKFWRPFSEPEPNLGFRRFWAGVSRFTRGNPRRRRRRGFPRVNRATPNQRASRRTGSFCFPRVYCIFWVARTQLFVVKFLPIFRTKNHTTQSVQLRTASLALTAPSK